MASGFNPIPGSQLYEQWLKNTLNAEQNYTPGYTSTSDQMGGAAALSEWQQAVEQGDINSLGILPPPPPSIGGSSSGSSSSRSGPASVMPQLTDIINEGLGITRGVGEKEMEKERRRLLEDWTVAQGSKIQSLARRGLYHAGIGEEEMQEEVDKPYSRGMSDLESALHDANVDTGLSKAGRFADFGSLLAEIEAQARRGAAERYSKASSIGTGGQTLGTGSGGFGSAAQIGAQIGAEIGTASDGGLFGATFSGARTGGGAGGGAGGGGGSGPTMDPYGGSGSFIDPNIPGPPGDEDPGDLPPDFYNQQEDAYWNSLYGKGGSAGPSILEAMYPGGYNPYSGGQIDSPFGEPTQQMRLNLPGASYGGTQSSGSTWM